jgi:hypothetical protein
VFVVCVAPARCKIERLAEVLFFRANARCKMAHPAGEKSLHRAANVYSAAAASYTAPNYSAHVGDALKHMKCCSFDLTYSLRHMKCVLDCQRCLLHQKFDKSKINFMKRRK